MRSLRCLRLSPRDVVVSVLSAALTTCVLIGQQLSGYYIPSLPQKIMASPPSTPPLDFDLEAFLSTFTAANDNYTEPCKAYLRNPSEFNRPRWDFINWRWHFSQYNQDWFMFVNFFHRMATQGIRGFYVESGANDWLRVSNTAFLDLCLGWEGLCIEPSTRYHEGIREHRTCELIPNCLSYKNETVNLVGEEINATGGVPVECVRLDQLLEQRNISTVHLWSLDIEGFEMNALKGMDFANFDVQTILMEQQELSNDPCVQIAIDFTLAVNWGFSKYRIVSDAFYLKPNYGPTYSTLRFPNRTALGEYFHELEDRRCTKKKPIFFTDDLQ